MIEPARYEDLGLLARGSTSEVRRVRDRVLNRTLALKILRAELIRDADGVARFVEEARRTAALQHPAVIPIHDFGVGEDGRAWYTMDEVRGRSFADLLASGDRDAPTRIQQNLAVLRRVADALGFAHANGIVHGGLEPADILIGQHGEVLVLDWSVGTGAAGVDADVRALGWCMAQVLVGGIPHDRALDALRDATVRRVPGVPSPLASLCLAAIEAPGGPADGAELSDALAAWLEGAQRRERAADMTREALDVAAGAPRLLARAAELEARGEASLRAIPRWRPEEEKHAAWRLLDEARDLRRSVRLTDVEVDQRLHAAVQVAPDAEETRFALADRYRQRLRHAEESGEDHRVSGLLATIRAHASALPPASPRRASLERTLAGTGAFTLHTDPSGATVEVFRYVQQNRRLVEERVGPTLRTPVLEETLPMGSYLAIVSHPGRAVVRYPFRVTREGHWDGVAPGETAPTPIRLPPEGWLGAGEIYVPAGWFVAGGDPEVFSLPRQHVWLDAFVMMKHHVTHREYLAYLNDLVASGRVDEAHRHAPATFNLEPGAHREPFYGFDGRRFTLPDDPVQWPGDGPVNMVRWLDANAYLDWLAERTGRPWRLPAELEFEKAARGVDGRWFPWGDHWDATRCLNKNGQRGTPVPAPVDTYPLDVGPTGVRGLAGNTNQACIDDFEAGPVVEGGRGVITGDRGGLGLRSSRGGSYASNPQGCRSAARSAISWEMAQRNAGFRGVFPME
ncbi:MAG: SUMF1/EgtB/PvdO family nonheme iron enzyme [Alphaproteobacteria bacterium]|nr:SUMF1/EgtB/PvdO family nonheme iron enzyme [Alphaproteobacteria bacterium]